MDHASSWEAAARLLAEHRDVLEGRPDEGRVPAALEARGWAAWLLALDDDALTALEVHGHEARWPTGAPPSLLALASAAQSVCALPSSSLASLASAGSAGLPRAAKRGETPRKRAQIEAFARVVAPLAGAAKRVIDVGSGHGHLTRDIAERIAVPVVGLERDATLANRAQELSSPSSSPPSFAVTDVLRDGLALDASDCVIGLHACGELGDAMVESVARAGASLALVGCCLQKRRSPSRRPLCDGFDLDLPKSLLGLSNLTARDDGVEATRSENLAARERRLALHRLLAAEVGELRLGAEIEGLNRRAAHRDLDVLVARAFAVRGLPSPSATVIREAESWAASHHARARRLALPRALLARPLEVFVLLDRARYLEARGFEVDLLTLFPPAVSARNLALVASRRRSAACELPFRNR
ncbi:MAG TPA: methyltransferase [Labilithrix sp.]|nr:methyltransferase [Labilithrix sp.]